MTVIVIIGTIGAVVGILWFALGKSRREGEERLPFGCARKPF